MIRHGRTPLQPRPCSRKIAEGPIGPDDSVVSRAAPLPVILRPKKNRRRAAPAPVVIKAMLPAALRAIGVALACAAIVFGTWQLALWARQSPRFSIDTIAVKGTVHATDAELTRLGNIQVGQNLVALDAFALERILAAHPWVKTVRVDRKFPRRLEITVKEHNPVAMVSLGDLYLLDDDGEPFKRVGPADALDLPIVTGVEREDFLTQKELTAQRLHDALALASEYRGDPLSEVHLDLDGVTLVTAAGQHLILGEGAWAEKLARLDRVRQELKARALTASVIRLDNRARPASITVSLKTPASSPERGGRPGK